ncbi:hypothetical protein OIV83_000647 [Microbotryomycetes sp. JL201]|nr:hypothetical protein OIV83_000647 [Microbotryomycetes sp. JL201]
MQQQDLLDATKLFSVKGKIALVSGGGTGIGLYIATGLATNGTKVYITGRRKDKLEAAASQFAATGNGGSLIPLQGDVSSKDSVAKLVEDYKKLESKLDILVNSAGVLHVDPIKSHPDDGKRLDNLMQALWSSEEAGWKNSLDVNVTALYFMSVGFAPLLHESYKQNPSSAEEPRETPNIINIGSIAGTHNARDAAAVSYQASKSAVNHLTKCLATRFVSSFVSATTVLVDSSPFMFHSFLPLHIRVNGINPGLFPSEMTKTDPKVLRETHKTHFRAMPEGRAGAPPDIAGPVIMLSSRAGAYINGNMLDVGGGRSLLLSGAILPDPK